MDCVDGTEPLLKYLTHILLCLVILKAIFFSGFCACTEGYTLMDELQDCIQFSDNGKNISNI